jgi:hypothetical protein
MDQPEATGAYQQPSVLPKSLRVIGWLSLALSVWSLGDDVIRALDGRGMRWTSVVLAVVFIAGAVGLLRHRRWGYLLTLGNWLLGVAWGVWFFFIQGEYTLAARLLGIPILLVAAIPPVFLLLPRARSWFKDGSRHA